MYRSLLHLSRALAVRIRDIVPDMKVLIAFPPVVFELVTHGDILHPTFFQIIQGIPGNLSSRSEEVRVVYPTARELAHTQI